MAEPPDTAEGWYVLHDFRRIDWDAWREASPSRRDAALESGVEYLAEHEAVADADDGDSAAFSVLGADADLLVIHVRPALDDLERAQRRFEATDFAGLTERADSYVSVTEVSGYVSRDYFEGGDVDEGVRSYIEGKLYPALPDADYVSFYPMSKRRLPDANWYDLAFDERAEMMAEHGDTGREFAGRIKQLITASSGFDDWEWGVTLFADDPTAIKDVVYEMRFDAASAKYADFGEFSVARRFPPSGLRAFMAGEALPSLDEADAAEDHPHGSSEGAGASHDHGAEDSPHGSGESPHAAQADAGASVREALADRDVYAGQPRGEDVHALALYSEADPAELAEEVDRLAESFDHYDTHVRTAVYQPTAGDWTAVVSLWETASAAETASGFLADLPGVVSAGPGEEAAAERADEGDSDSPGTGGEGTAVVSPPEETAGWGTMGMFYTVKPEYREEFVEKFETVGGLLADMDGHVGTDLLANREDENDMFIASRWRSKDDAMAFFRSEAFRDTVSWGRDVLADRPRHVFLA